MQEQRRAEHAAAAMLQNDRATEWFGITLEAIAPGFARMALKVEAHHLNGHGSCHGGVIFALADSAFAVACNSDNLRAVAQHNTISYLSPAALGDVLSAEARVVSTAGRSGITDVAVTAEDNRIIAHFRGASRRIGGTNFQEEN